MRFNDVAADDRGPVAPVAYAQVRSVLEKRAKQIGSDGSTPLDQRLADALVSLTRGEGGTSGAPLVVAHVPFEVWAILNQSWWVNSNGRADQRRRGAAPAV